MVPSLIFYSAIVVFYYVVYEALVISNWREVYDVHEDSMSDPEDPDPEDPEDPDPEDPDPEDPDLEDLNLSVYGSNPIIHLINVIIFFIIPVRQPQSSRIIIQIILFVLFYKYFVE